MLRQEVLPFGYIATGNNESAIDAACKELAELQGEFEKPKYFEYDASICAHSRSSITACTNCLDVCGTGAITSDGEGIKIEPYLARGVVAVQAIAQAVLFVTLIRRPQMHCLS